MISARHQVAKEKYNKQANKQNEICYQSLRKVDVENGTGTEGDLTLPGYKEKALPLLDGTDNWSDFVLSRNCFEAIGASRVSRAGLLLVKHVSPT